MRILITGASSMIGRPIVKLLVEEGHEVDSVLHSETDLLDLEQTRNRFLNFRPENVIHLAAYNGGIEFNRKYPADIYYQTAQIGLNVLKSCKDFRVQKVISILSSCSYPDLKDDELHENSLHNGQPNLTVECHAMAKRSIEIYSRMLYKQYNLKAITCVVNNAYGEYDNFDVNKTKVIGALINKFVTAKENNNEYVELFGTGKPLRQFIYAGDVAKLLCSALQCYNDPLMPVNIAGPQEISIKELAETIKEIVGYTGKIKWLTSFADGQMRKRLSLERMNSILPKINFTPIKNGLEQTIKWYLNARTK